MVERNEENNVLGSIGHTYRRSTSWRRKKSRKCFVLASVMLMEVTVMKDESDLLWESVLCF